MMLKTIYLLTASNSPSANIKPYIQKQWGKNDLPLHGQQLPSANVKPYIHLARRTLAHTASQAVAQLSYARWRCRCPPS